MTTDSLLSCMHAWTWTVQHAPSHSPPAIPWRVEAWPKIYGVSISLTLHRRGQPWREVRQVVLAQLIGSRDCAEVGRALNRVVAGLFRLGGAPVPEHYAAGY
ncbi:hypothetical protein JOF53_000402 [Crossiella equi]|uniref:Uncharacterized protein n=1 Tax=Crossiella equi TaxID=130796 RepID=A0ABS5A4M2_9PSEU|nr:hypothetical protein [Crossiella equi]MBP2471530.1 hypothetical protein [Crossiella equi]